MAEVVTEMREGAVGTEAGKGEMRVDDAMEEEEGGKEKREGEEEKEERHGEVKAEREKEYPRPPKTTSYFENHSEVQLRSKNSHYLPQERPPP